MMTAIIGFLVNTTAIYAGAKLSKQQDVNFPQCLAVALLSILTVWVAHVLVAPLALIAPLAWLASAVACWLGTSFAAKYVLNIEWRPALMIGGAVALIHIILALVLHLAF